MKLRTTVVGLAAGLLFGAGLALSGMTNPAKVMNFLDVTRWDPSLALVMAAAIPVSALAFRFAARRERPLFGAAFSLPEKTRLDASLLIGSALFGLGWGLGGYCPGPAVASLSDANAPLLGFLAAMTVGMLLAGLIGRRRALQGDQGRPKIRR
ncbi:MAG: YeeE/YedE family protein [Alphaproteobacteria bacterium]|nr:YeeE/YedE family protein [Alphaproteobacteria bacterium]